MTVSIFFYPVVLPQVCGLLINFNIYLLSSAVQSTLNYQIATLAVVPEFRICMIIRVPDTA